jgi:hypothetical protein
VGLLALLPLYSYDLWDCLVDSLVIMYSIDINLFPDFLFPANSHDFWIYGSTLHKKKQD